MSKRLTPWFPPSVKPARKGVYERDWAFAFSYWNGMRWCVGCTTPDVAAGERERSLYQDIQWRGLAKEPK